MKRHMMKYTLKIVGLYTILLFNVSISRAQANLSISDFKIAKGEVKNITINMSNHVEIRALQVQVVFPTNIKLAARPTIVKKRQGTMTDEFGDKVNATKTLNYRLKEDGSCVIVVNANDAIPFDGNEGAIINLPIKATDDALTGMHSIKLQNMELVYADGFTYIRPQDESCEVEVYNMNTSIENLMKDKFKNIDVYGTDGKRILSGVSITNIEDVLPRGIYVIDGYKVVIEK